MMQPENPWSRVNDRLEDLERARKADRSTPIRNASIDGPVTISHRGAVTAPSPNGGTTTVSPDGATTTAVDGSATRLADGVAEVKAGPDDEWVPLETVILDQVPAPSDGLPPATAPTVELIPGVGTVFVKITPPENADPITGITVYVNGNPVHKPFDGLLSVGLDAAGDPLPYDTDTTFAFSASDVDGEGPLSAPQSARPIKIAPGDLAQTIIDQIDEAGETADSAQAVADQAAADATAAQALAAAAETPAGAQAKADVATAIAVAAQADADAALAAATTAQSSANGKSTNYYSGANPPADGAPGYKIADTWVKFTGGNLVGRWVHNGTGFRSEIIPDAMIGNLDAAKINTGFLNVAILIEAGAITGDLVAANTITGDNITANTITADNIAANTITSDEIAARSITGTEIAANITLSTFFKTADAGYRSEWDSDSMRFFAEDGSLGTRLSGDGSYMSGTASLENLETQEATLGGATLGPAGGTFKLGSSIIEKPRMTLDHLTVPVERKSTTPSSRYIFPSNSTAMWRTSVFDAGPLSTTSRSLGMRFADANGANAVGVRWTWQSVQSRATYGAMTATVCFVYAAGQIYSRPRSATGDALGFAVATMEAPGTGGYAAEGPVIGVQRTSGQLLVAHRVQGAQTIGGVAYANNEVMVRRYAVGGSASSPTLTLAQTVRIPLVCNALASVEMAAAGSMFDTPNVTGNTGLLLGIRKPGLSFGQNAAIISVPDSGASVTAAAIGGSLFSWYADPDNADTLGVMWDGSSFWSNDVTGDAVRKFGNNSVAINDVWHAYTYTDGINESQMSTPIKSRTLGRFVSRWTIPPLPAGVTMVRLYQSLDGTARNRFERVGTFTGAPGQSLAILQNPIQPPAGTATNQPPAVSNFTNGSTYKFFDDAGNMWTGGYMTVRDPIMPTDVTNKRYVDEKVPIGGSVTVPSGTGVTNVTVSLGVTLPDANYVVTATPNSTSLTQWATSGYTTTGFNVTVNRAAAGTYVMRWILLLL